MRKVAFLLVPALLLILAIHGCGESPIEPSSDVSLDPLEFKAEPSHNMTRTQEEFTLSVGCLGGEPIDFAIEVMEQWTSFYDAAGGYHYHLLWTDQGEAIGRLSGSKWRDNETWHQTIYIGPNEEYPYVFNDGVVSLWQGTGGAPSFNLWSRTRYTVNGIGELSVEIDSFKLVCID